MLPLLCSVMILSATPSDQLSLVLALSTLTADQLIPETDLWGRGIWHRVSTTPQGTFMKGGLRR